MDTDWVVIVGARGAFDRESLLDAISRARREHDAVVQAFDPGAVYGRRHLEAAVAKALRAEARGRPAADDLATAIACYAAGDPQIAAALGRVGLPERGNGVLLVGLGERGGRAVEDVVAAAGLERDAGLLAERETTLDRLGIPPKARELVKREKWGLLVLERVALVDALR